MMMEFPRIVGRKNYKRMTMRMYQVSREKMKTVSLGNQFGLAVRLKRSLGSILKLSIFVDPIASDHVCPPCVGYAADILTPAHLDLEKAPSHQSLRMSAAYVTWLLVICLGLLSRLTLLGIKAKEVMDKYMGGVSIVDGIDKSIHKSINSQSSVLKVE
ncbi:hypothetical protein U1Q18_039630 [Sarracenia purpurea var. burkii]